MHDSYKRRISEACDDLRSKLGNAATEADIVTAQNQFNNTLNEIKADIKARPDGPPKRAKSALSAPDDDPTPIAPPPSSKPTSVA